VLHSSELRQDQNKFLKKWFRFCRFVQSIGLLYGSTRLPLRSNLKLAALAVRTGRNFRPVEQESSPGAERFRGNFDRCNDVLSDIKWLKSVTLSVTQTQLEQNLQYAESRLS
jgi:hypothetical protein